MKIIQSIPSPTISYFDLGPFKVHFYALFILTGIVFAVWLGNRRFKARGGNGGAILDIALWAVPVGIIGGRFYHVITHLHDYFYAGADVSKVFAIWEGGLAIYGALLFGTLGAYIGARTAGIRFLAFADAIAPGVIVAQAIGRLGNYFNNELFGLPTTLPWGLEIPVANPAYPEGLPAGVLFHPTFLYEILWNLLGFAVILLLERKLNLRWGQVFGAYLVIYSIGRAFIESIRIDPSDYYLGLRTNVWSAIFGIVVGVAIIWWSRRNHSEPEMSPYIAGREPKVDEQSDAVGEGFESSDELESKSNNAAATDSQS